MAVSSLSDVEMALDLEHIADTDVFVGKPFRWTAENYTGFITHLFGGLIAAQSVVAANRTVPESHRIHSLHSYFILAGDGRLPILFQVTRIRDGKSFKTRQVLALQRNKPIFMMIASFHKDEPGPEFQRTPEELAAVLGVATGTVDLRTPEELQGDGMKIDYGGTRSTAALKIYSGQNHSLLWRKHTTKIQDAGWSLHAAILAFMSDEGFLSTVQQPYPDLKVSMMTSLDHTIHFHRPFRVDEWMLFHNETTVSSGSRGVARTEIWTTGGVLVASVMQEGLVRPSRDWAPSSDLGAELTKTGSRTMRLLRAQSKAKL